MRIAGRFFWPLALTLSLGACENFENLDSPTAPPQLGSLELAAMETGYAADAFGTQVKVGTTVKSDKTAPVSLACAAQPPASRSNTVATVDLSPAGQTGTVTTSAEALTLSGGVTAARAMSTVQTVNLLGGLITAAEVRAVSTTQLGPRGYSVSAAGSLFTSLRVNGVAIAANVAPNTRIDLPGFGHVILNKQVQKFGSSSADLTVIMIHVVITQDNVLGIPVNSNIIVANAHSHMQQPGPNCGCEGPLTGFAYGSQVTGDIVKSGKTANIGLPCNGTNGVVKSKTVLTVDVTNVMTLGQVVNTAQGTVNLPSAEGKTTSTVESVNLLDGLVTADVIKAVAHVTTSGGPVSTSTTGTTFANLHVSGHPEIDANVSANAQVKLDGLGTLWLRRVIQTSKSVEVRMIELIVEQNNALGLPIGTRVQIGVAKAGIK